MLLTKSLVWGWAIGIAGTIALHLPAIAESVSAQPAPAPVLWVNPTGNDATANGSDRAPFKTISRALQMAQPGTTIQLAPGTYSRETGEVFPIVLKAGVTLQGDTATRGQGIVIRGSGMFSRPSARYAVTILAADQATIAGVTVTNPDRGGYGLWIEANRPIVTDNTFTGSGHNGISTGGDSAPLIRNNFFWQNGANGITIDGTARPELRENIFENTGFGISINQKAAPQIIGNRITQNQDGIVIQAEARPVLRNNSIEGNRRDGLVAIAQSRPDLGTVAEPGGNLFRNNGQFDVNAKSDQVIPAIGNEMAKTDGSLDLAGTSAARTGTAFAPSEPGSDLSAASFPTPAIDPDAVKSTAMSPPSSVQPGARRVQVVQVVNFGSPLQAPEPPRLAPLPQPTAPIAQFTPVPRLVTPVAPRSTVATAPLSSVPIQPRPPIARSVSIPIVVPPPERWTPTPLPVKPEPPKELPKEIVVSRPPQPTRSRAPLLAATTVSPPPITAPLPPSNLLPVPNARIPIGNVGTASGVNLYRPSASGVSPFPVLSSALSLPYRVVVEANDAARQTQLRSLVPAAFRTYLNGRMVLQAGAFSDRGKADELVQLLSQQGVTATIEQVKQDEQVNKTSK